MNFIRWRPLLFATLLVLPAQPAQAQFNVAVSVEHFQWTEATRPKVEETGPRGAFSLGWTQPDSTPVRFGIQATVYGGYVEYEGSLLFEPNTPASGTTSYLGTTQEALIRIRAAQGVDLIGGVGFDLWLRRLSADQREDFTVGFFRVGGEIVIGSEQGWLLGGGVRCPFSTSEDAHLTLLGFDRNRRLAPRGKVSGFGQAGYRFRSRWSVVGYLDGWYFDASAPVPVTIASSGVSGVVFQPRSDLKVLGLKFTREF